MCEDYTYVLTCPPARTVRDIRDEGFAPAYTPAEMLQAGVFSGVYLNDCMDEFPREWFERALEAGTLSPEGQDPRANQHGVCGHKSLPHWRRKKWIIGDDERGWFQWYCRYFLGRRDARIDEIQKRRWRSHARTVSKNKTPRGRQNMLHWSCKSAL